MELRPVENFLKDQHRDKIPTPEGRVVVVGPACSGTRILTWVIEASPDLSAFHDQTHGARDYGLDDPKGYVVITRDPECTDKSRQARFGKQVRSREVSMREINANYKHVPWVTYEDLVGDTQSVIDMIAEHFGVPTWKWVGEPIVDENKKWIDGEVST